MRSMSMRSSRRTLAGVLCLIALRADGALVFRDPDAPVAARMRDLIGQLTPAEKYGQLGTRAPAIPRLGIAAFPWGNECLHGVATAGATAFPQSLALAARW